VYVSVCVCASLFRIYVIVVEHDLSVLDYLSDFVCCLYGVPSAYGTVCTCVCVCVYVCMYDVRCMMYVVCCMMYDV